jgi:epoxyqueuosine reductase
MDAGSLTQEIKNKAKELGFDGCGIAKAEKMEEEGRQLKEWLENGMHAEMKYMENHFDLRIDPALLWPGAKSVVVVTLNYFTGKINWNNPIFRISNYALGLDYHDVIRDKLTMLLDELRLIYPEVNGRVCVDSAPIMEKKLAERAGLGWQGKNSLLLTKKNGSYVFLGILLLDFELEYDKPESDHCGSCHKCLAACPTHAIVSPGVVDSRNCISYQTIERKDNFDPEPPLWNNWIFGCDICQEVCPYNHGAVLTKMSEFQPRKEIINLTAEEWTGLEEEQYREIFRKSPVKRAKYRGLKRNIDWVKNRKI